MPEAIVAPTLAEAKGDGAVKADNQGVLESSAKSYSIFPFAGTEAMTQGTFDFLCEMNSQPLPEVLNFQAILITRSQVEIQDEVMKLLADLAKMGKAESGKQPGAQEMKTPEKVPESPKNSPAPKSESRPKERAPSRPTTSPTFNRSEGVKVASSIFALAKALSQEKSRESAQSKNQESRRETVQQEKLTFREMTKMTFTEQKKFRDKEEGRGGQQDQRDQQEEPEKKKTQNLNFGLSSSDSEGFTTQISGFSAEVNGQRPFAKQKSSRDASKVPEGEGEKPKVQVNITIEKIQTSKGAPAAQAKKGGGDAPPVESMDNIFIRFMALMARILGQAEAEAHALYLRIKERTDDIDTLTKLASKINSADGKIDWSKDEEMKKLVDRARELGVDIPEGKYKWTEEEKKLLKENIQMRKDSMEKITQLERTDMQRYLQEAAQCHQARSNVLKLLKEIIDTIIHNIRPS